MDSLNNSGRLIPQREALAVCQARQCPILQKSTGYLRVVIAHGQQQPNQGGVSLRRSQYQSRAAQLILRVDPRPIFQQKPRSGHPPPRETLINSGGLSCASRTLTSAP